jgi:hypothetical protein
MKTLIIMTMKSVDSKQNHAICNKYVPQCGFKAKHSDNSTEKNIEFIGTKSSI